MSAQEEEQVPEEVLGTPPPPAPRVSVFLLHPSTSPNQSLIESGTRVLGRTALCLHRVPPPPLCPFNLLRVSVRRQQQHLCGSLWPFLNLRLLRRPSVLMGDAAAAAAGDIYHLEHRQKARVALAQLLSTSL